MIEVQKRDETRRKRVGEIFGEGCFSTSEDYAAAALVYQHGDTPDHFFQTYIWSKRAVVNTGHKQLFGSQAMRPGPTESTCWCLDQIEKTFPDKRRKGKTCPNIECEAKLKPSPKGTVPGFW